MTTALTLIESSMRLAGVLAEGETPTGTAAADALSALNQMLDSWSVMRLNVYATQNQQLTWPANTATRTVGATGQLVGVRPIEVSPSTYYIASGITYQLKVITQYEYDAIIQKTQTSSLPEFLAVNMTVTNATLTMYPIPTGSIELHLVSVVELTQPASTSTTLSVPPGYMRAIRYNLAVEICNEFGVEASRNVLRTAENSLRAIKRINSKSTQRKITLPSFLGVSRSNIELG